MTVTRHSLPPASPPWIVIKFGGTSVASVERWLQIERIARRHLQARRALIVCSALATVTDRLTEIASAVEHGQYVGAALADVAAANRTHFSFVVHESALAPLAALAHGALFGRDARACVPDQAPHANVELSNAEEAVA